MKLIVFGATGGTGRELVKQGLKQGHEVTAIVRDPDKLAPATGLRIVQADVLNADEVARAVSGHEAVLCALGKPNIMDSSQLRVKGTRHIVAAMKGCGVPRLVCQSALGTAESLLQLPFEYRYLLVPLVMRHLYRDHGLQEVVIRESGLEWVIVRPAALTNGARTDNCRHDCGSEKTIRSKIARADVAAFMLQQVTSDQLLYKAPVIYT